MSNMAPVICKKLPFLKYPIDFGKKFRGRPIFGKNKTIRGLVVGIIFGIITTYLQFLLKDYTQAINIINYENWLMIGFLLGFGAILGDIIESFFKRQIGIKSGQPWIPFDQLDFIIGALLMISIVFIPDWTIILTLLLISPILHIIVNHTAYFLKIRGEKW